ncbi:MAG: PEP-CTERM sorting domain-containing protein [Terriglobia bacterium]
MKKILLVFALMVAFSALGISDPVSCSTVGTSLSDFIALGSTGCAESNLLFSDFFFPNPASTGGATLPSADNVSVNVDPSGTGLTFNAALIAGPNQTADVVIDYVVRVLSGGPITGSGLKFEAGASNGGLVAVDETQCAGAMLPMCTGGTITQLNGNANSPLDTNTINNATLLSVNKDILVSGGTQAGGQASISDEDQIFTTTTVPEPASLMLFGLGMLGVAFVVRRETKTASSK